MSRNYFYVFNSVGTELFVNSYWRGVWGWGGGHGNNGSRTSHEYITWLINYYIAPHSHTNRASAQWFNYTFQKRGLLGFLSPPPSLCDSALFAKTLISHSSKKKTAKKWKNAAVFFSLKGSGAHRSDDASSATEQLRFPSP